MTAKVATRLREKLPNEPTEEHDRLAHEVIGALIEVHRVLGPGLRESVYEEALCIELTLRGLSFVRQPAVDFSYKGRQVGKGPLAVRRKTVPPDLRVRRVAPHGSQTPDSEVRRYWNIASKDSWGRLLDLLVGDKLVVELKAVEALTDLHKAQLISYPRTTGHQPGLLISFNVPALRNGIKRIVSS